MDVDAHVVASVVTGVVALASAARAHFSARSVAAQLKACAELDARVRGYIDGREPTKRVKGRRR